MSVTQQNLMKTVAVRTSIVPSTFLELFFGDTLHLKSANFTPPRNWWTDEDTDDGDPPELLWISNPQQQQEQQPQPMLLQLKRCTPGIRATRIVCS